MYSITPVGWILIIAGPGLIAFSVYESYVRPTYQSWRAAGKHRSFLLILTGLSSLGIFVVVNIVFFFGSLSEPAAVLLGADVGEGTVVLTLYLLVIQLQANKDSNEELRRLSNDLGDLIRASKVNSDRIAVAVASLSDLLRDRLPEQVKEESPDD